MSRPSAHERWVRVAAGFLAISYAVGAPLTAYIEYGSHTISQRFGYPPAFIYLICAVQLVCSIGVLVRPLASWAAAAYRDHVRSGRLTSEDRVTCDRPTCGWLHCSPGLVRAGEPRSKGWRPPLSVLQTAAARLRSKLTSCQLTRADSLGWRTKLMAIDLAGASATGLQAQLCGDAHLGNFGVFASLLRELARLETLAAEVNRESV